MGNLKYGTYDEETAQQEKEELESSGADFVKIKVGKNVLRVLPPPPGQRTPFRVVYQHFVEMPGGRQSIICARLEAKKPCAVCQKVDELRKSKLDADQKAASDLFARRRVFCNVVDRSDPDKVKVWAFGKQIHEQLVAFRDAEVGGDYVNPEEGFDVIVERTGTGKNDTKYKVFLRNKPSPLASTEEKMQELIDTQANLDGYAKLKSFDEVRALLSGEDPEEEEEVAPPPRRAPVGATGRTSAARPNPSNKRRTAEDDAIDTDGEEVEED